MGGRCGVRCVEEGEGLGGRCGVGVLKREKGCNWGQLWGKRERGWVTVGGSCGVGDCRRQL